MTTLKSANKMKALFASAVVMVMAGVALPTTYTVTNTSDSADGSLKWAIEEANRTSGPDIIKFEIPETDPGYDPITGIFVIQPVGRFPELTEEVVIDGYTQPGSQPAIGTSNAILKIVLDGSSSSVTLGLLSIDPGAGSSEIRGLVISNYDRNGIFIESGANGNVIEGNYIEGNQECGIYIKSANNRIGGTTSDARNVISCNRREGIIIYGAEASGNRVLGNYIGTDASGTISLPNEGIGVAINNAPDNLVGGTAPGSRNVITDVSIGNPDATNNQVVGNYIGGINAAGTGLLLGLDMRDSAVHIGEASHNVIGPDNVISGCTRPVLIWPGASHNTVRDNFIGTDATGQVLLGGIGLDGVNIHGSCNRIEGNIIAGSTRSGINIYRAFESEVPTQNLITRNAIYGSGAVGIDLGDDRVTPNDPGDMDLGPNNLMNFPVLTSARATPGQLIVQGTIDTQNPRQVVLEFFANSTPGAMGYGEGEIFLGSDKPNAQGKFTATLPTVSAGMWISATATDSDGNTSEFALSIEAEGPGGGK